MSDLITRLQERNTELVLENRALRARLGMAGLLADVKAFHEKFGVETRSTPGLPSRDIQKLRHDLIHEEFFEFQGAWINNDQPAHLVGIADALADMVYVIVGTALAYGIPLDAVWDEVQRSNMAKVGGPTREDGKILKPEGWQPPNIEAILEAVK
jgi:predicted HAD superfamily Cof-like phosphohydrolase